MTNVVKTGKRFDADTSTTFKRILNTLDLDEKKVLDLGCGYGEHLMKFGKDSVGITTTNDEVEYGIEANLKIVKGNVELIDSLNLENNFQAIWANNLFEHLLSPHAFLMKLKLVADNDSRLVLGVPVVPKISTLMKFKKFRGALASPHINFFTKETLSLTVTSAGWIIEEVRPFIFKNYLLDKMISLFVPHLYIIARNDSNFIYPEKKYKEWKDDTHYQDLLNIGGRKENISKN